MEAVRQKAHELIKEASKENHQQLEKKVVTVLKNMRNEEDYFLLLNIFYNYFNALESKMEAFITPDILSDYSKRRKSAMIRNDIKALGFEIIKNDNIKTPEISDHWQAMAALYVMEGSTLGGSIIVKMLRQKKITAGTSFFAGYGEATFPMWHRFLEVLNKLPENEADTEKIIKTVKDTFDCFYLLFTDKEINDNA